MAENDIEALAVEAMAKAHCDFFGGEGWWDTGLIADTKPKAIDAMRAALTALRSTTAATDSAAKDAEIARAADLMKAIQHSVQMAMVPGNDWRRELRLIQGLTEAALANRGEAGALAKERGE